jgi:hypothetical protein
MWALVDTTNSFMLWLCWDYQGLGAVWIFYYEYSRGCMETPAFILASIVAWCGHHFQMRGAGHQATRLP